MPAEDTEMQRRHSSVTESATNSAAEFGGLKRQISHENVELIPTRTTKVATSKPAANPLQFIKVGPCNLYRSAQEQLKKVDEVKKVKQEVRDDAEDWQSNLDNWKCSRRKKQEHIIERVVEVKKLELEEHDRNRRRSKTFSEMMEERNSRGRKLSLPLYQDDNNDLSDLGISKGSRSNSIVPEESENNSGGSEYGDDSSCSHQNGNGLNGHKEESSTSRASSEAEEYTYERAIQSYVNFTETRVKSRNSGSSRSSPEENGPCNGQFAKRSPPVPVKPRRGSTTKIEEKLCELEQLKKRSMSTTDLTAGEPNKKQVVVPKIDINKRRELFEKITDQDDQSLKANRLSGDFSNSKSIRERLSSLGKQTDEIAPHKKKVDRVSGEISVKDRLSNIEKHHRSTENVNSVTKVNRVTSETLINSQSVRERLDSLEKSVNKDPAVKPLNTNTPLTEHTMTMTEARQEVDKQTIVNSLETSQDTLDKTITMTNGTSSSTVNEKASNDASSDLKDSPEEFKSEGVVEQFERTLSPEEEIYENKRQQHFRHRSLDSLDVDSNEGLGNECFERVQSLEDLDFCRNYPASSLSGDTDREDSGIHTADVSSSVSQADDCDSHLDSSSVDTEFKFQHQPTIEEEKTRQPVLEIPPTQLTISIVDPSAVSPKDESESSQVTVVSSSTSFSSSSTSSSSNLKLPLRSDHLDPLPAIPECPSEPVTPSDIIVSLVPFDNVVAKETTIVDSQSSVPNNIASELTAEDVDAACNSFSSSSCTVQTSVSTNDKNTEEVITDSAAVINSNNEDGNSLSTNFVDNDPKQVPNNITENSAEPVNSVNSNFSELNETIVVKMVADNTSTASSNSPPSNYLSSTSALSSASSYSSSSSSADNKAEAVRNVDGGSEGIVCMRGQSVSRSEPNTAKRRQTVIELCEKVDSSELASPLATPVISVNDFKFDAKEKATVKEDFTSTKKEENNFISIEEDLCRKDIDGHHLIKSEVMITDKIEIYNDIEDCKRVAANNYSSINSSSANIIDLVAPSPTIIGKTEIIMEDNVQPNLKPVISALPVVEERKNFFIEKSNNQLPELDLNVNGEIEGEMVFPLSPSTLEPPKEKPPPPPAELSDDDDDSIAPPKPSSLRRLDSTKRIKKEIRQKRSSFLGLEGGNDDSLEPELEIQPPPDMTSFLQEERRLEQLMYRQSICSESDSNQGESRDSGVELDRSHHDDIAWPNHNHSRHDSETFGNASTTSEEEENIKKERELIMERISERNQEQQTYITNTTQEQDNIGEKLALRLRELEAEKTRLEWEREEELNRRKVEEAARCHQETIMQAREVELRKQETVLISTGEVSVGDSVEQEYSGEMLISERERLEREQQELTRQRESLLLQQQWAAASLQDVSQQGVSSPTEEYSDPSHDYRRSMPNLPQEPPPPRHTRPPPPIPPAKPLVIPRTSLQEKPTKRTSSPQQMSRQTLQALSAAPRSRLIPTDTWIQTKRKPKQENYNNNYNYQHWLIQEAEHRRITELQQRQAVVVPPKRPAPPHPSAYPGGQQPQQQQQREHHHQQPPPPQMGRNTVWQQPPSPVSQGPNGWSAVPSQPPHGAQWVPGSGPQPQPQPRNDKPLPDDIIQTLTQRVQNRINNNNNMSASSINNNAVINNRRRHDVGVVDPQQRIIQQQQQPSKIEPQQQQQQQQEKMLSVSGKKKCSHCGEELGRGAAMIIETLRLFYHIDCFKCCVCCVQLGDGLMGTDVRVRNNKLHCQNCYSSDDGVKFSCV